MQVSLRHPDRVQDVDGPLRVDDLLDALDIAPHTVLVISDGQLVTGSHVLGDDASVEVRPVISGGSDSVPRCAECRATAVIEERRHRAAWCAEHYPDHVTRQVRRAIDQPPGERSDGPSRMFSYADRLLIAVSGGKDSLALWDVLLDLGYRVDGLYVGLGIGGYSTRSLEVCRGFADARSALLHVVDLADTYGYTTPTAARATGRGACGVCGLSKRYVFNRVAVDHGYDVVVTGHNLDDEAAVLLGNLLRWNDGMLARQQPLLEASGDNQVRRCKPLYRLSERETAAYCVVKGIDYVVEECPLVDGNTGQELKAALDLLEAATPGVKAQLLFGFLERRAAFAAGSDEASVTLSECEECGMPTVTDVCAFCRQRDRIAAVLPQVGAGVTT
ncbi:MAG: ATP-binding protein [Nitriliruptoraceae bacterium]